jgi:hypothetical protein
MVMRRLRVAALVLFCLGLPSVVPGQELAGPAEGKARVYVFQFAALWAPRHAPFLKAQLFDGHSYVGFVEPEQYYGFDLDPGTHVLWSKYANQKWFLRAEVEAGRTYYVHLLMIQPRMFSAAALSPSLINVGRHDTRGTKTMKKINKRVAKHGFVVQEPETAEHLEAMQEALGPMIEEVMATWDEVWAKEHYRWDVLHKSDYVGRPRPEKRLPGLYFDEPMSRESTTSEPAATVCVGHARKKPGAFTMDVVVKNEANGFETVVHLVNFDAAVKEAKRCAEESIPLEPGVNEIRARAVNGGKAVVRITRETGE